MKKEFSAGGIVFRKDEGIEVLMIKDHNGKWTFPKGNIDEGESSEEAAIREVKEETGIKNVKSIKKIGDVKYFYQLEGEKIFKIVVFFLMKTEDKELKPQWEVQDAKWFPLDEVLKNINYKNLKETAENAVREIKNSFICY